MRVPFFPILLCCVALTLWSTPGHAEDEDPRVLADQAYEAFTRGDYEEALAGFERAHQLDEHPILLFNVGRCHEEQLRLPTARELYTQVLERSRVSRVNEAAIRRIREINERLAAEGYDPARVTEEMYRPPVAVRFLIGEVPGTVYANGRVVGSGREVEVSLRQGLHAIHVAAEGHYPFTQLMDLRAEGPAEFSLHLEPRSSLEDYVPPPPGRLTVIGPTAGMAVYVDGRLIGPLTPVRDYVLPEGPWSVVVRHPLYEEFRTTVNVRAGEETRVVADPVMVPVDRAAPLTGRQRIGVGLMAAGGALAIAGGGTGLAALKSEDRYHRLPEAGDRAELRDRAGRQALATDVLLLSGATIGVTGALLRWVKPRGPASSVYEERLLDFEVMPVPRGGGASMRVRF